MEKIKGDKYKLAIGDLFSIIDKTSTVRPFILNKVQEKYLLEDCTGRDVILKARQQGFSSLILAMFTVDFLFKDNTRSVIVADNSDNAAELLDRVKFYIHSYEEKRGHKIPMKYNSKYELYNEFNGSRYTIGTAENKEIGRSKTINNLHLSEFAFYPDPERLFAGIMQAVVPDGRVVIETTANGFNFFKDFWDECKQGIRPFKPLFYPSTDFYSPEFLESKKGELGRLFDQEYPSNDTLAFLTSGDLYFNPEALQYYLSRVQPPQSGGIYV